jgi:hypothetical protein
MPSCGGCQDVLTIVGVMPFVTCVVLAPHLACIAPVLCAHVAYAAYLFVASAATQSANWPLKMVAMSLCALTTCLMLYSGSHARASGARRGACTHGRVAAQPSSGAKIASCLCGTWSTRTRIARRRCRPRSCTRRSWIGKWGGSRRPCRTYATSSETRCTACSARWTRLLTAQCHG